MRRDDFHIGLIFLSSGGFRWRCTDIGTRTIQAIRFDADDSIWQQGPPYVLKEEVFDEHEMESCHLTHAEAITASVTDLKVVGHPGYPNEVVAHMLRVRRDEAGRSYPRPGVLRFDRRRPDGEILHPYASRREKSSDWTIALYLPFLGTYDEMAERDLIALPIASPHDVRRRAARI